MGLEFVVWSFAKSKIVLRKSYFVIVLLLTILGFNESLKIKLRENLINTKTFYKI